MKINFQKLMRVLPSLITVVVIVSFCCIPAFAAPVPVNIWEYADIQVDGLTKEVTIAFPVEWLQVGVYANSWKLIATRDGNVSGFDLSEAEFPFEYMNVVFAPFGSVHNPSALDAYNGRYPNFADLPNGSVLHYSVSVQLQNAGGESLNVVQSRFNRSDLVQSGNTVQLRNPVNEQVSFTSDVATGVYSSSYDFVLADNTKPFVFQHYFFISSSNASSRWIFRLDNFTITTTLDAIKDLQNSVDRNNELLNEIKEQMNINNQNWQDFLDGKAEWQDIVDTSTDKVEDAVDDMNDVSDALATVPKPEIDIETLVPDELAGQEYLNYINVIQQIWSNPLISTVTYIMGCLLILSYLLFGERG